MFCFSKFFLIVEFFGNKLHKYISFIFGVVIIFVLLVIEECIFFFITGVSPIRFVYYFLNCSNIYENFELFYL